MKNDELDQIYRDCYPAIYRYLFSLCKSSSVAEDLAHEAFVRALLHITDCNYSTIKSWLFKVAHNLYLDLLKKDKRLAFDQNIEDIAQDKKFEDELLSDIQYKEILNLIDKLPQNQKIAVLLCDVSEIEQMDAARMLEISFPALRNLLLRARRKLRVMLKEEICNE